MADIIQTEATEAAAQAAGAGPDTQTKIARSFLSSQMLGAVKGYAHKRPVRGAQAVDGTNAFVGGTNELSQEEEFDKAIIAEKSLRDSIRKSISNPEAVRKGLNPSFTAEYPLFGTSYGVAHPRTAALEQQVAN